MSRQGQLAAALIPMHDTPLGPLADNLTLRQIGLADRLCRDELSNSPLAGGDSGGPAPGYPAFAAGGQVVRPARSEPTICCPDTQPG